MLVLWQFWDLGFLFSVNTLIFTLVKNNLHKFNLKYEMNVKWNLYFRRKKNNGRIWRPLFIPQIKNFVHTLKWTSEMLINLPLKKKKLIQAMSTGIILPSKGTVFIFKREQHETFLDDRKKVYRVAPQLVWSVNVMTLTGKWMDVSASLACTKHS